MSKAKSDTLFTDYATEKDPEKKKQLGKRIDKAMEKRLSDYQEQAEKEHQLDELMPEPLTELKETPVKEVRTDITKTNENGELVRKTYKSNNPTETTRVYRKNPNLVQLINFGKNKIYYDSDKNQFFEYVVSTDRASLLQINRLEKHDLLNMLTVSFADICMEKENVPYRFYFKKKLRSKIVETIQKINEQTYGSCRGKDENGKEMVHALEPLIDMFVSALSRGKTSND